MAEEEEEEEEEEEKVRAFLNKLKTMDPAIYIYQRDIVLNSEMIRRGMLDRSRALTWCETTLRNYNGRAPFQGMNVGNAKNLSHDDLEKITNNFSDCIENSEHAILYRGFMDNGHEVTVKTWNFTFPSAIKCVDYPRNFHDEIVLLERSELKSCPFLMKKLIGFCFEKKLALVYDLKFKKSLRRSFGCAEFGWKERMKVATDYALLLKTLTVEKLDLVWSSDDIMIDEEYNIKLVNFRIDCRAGGTSGVAAVSDDTAIAEEIAKEYVFEFGILLMELIMKLGRDWEHMCQLSLYLRQRKGGSVVHKTLEVDVDTDTEITKLIGSCVRVRSAERPDIDYVISELKRIVGSGSDRVNPSS